jgi:hypothetical protein
MTINNHSQDAMSTALAAELSLRRLAVDDFRGYDPYDALSSPLFRLPVMQTNHFVRWAAQQTLKRVPINVRPLLGIRMGRNPVTLALAAQTCAQLALTNTSQCAQLKDLAQHLVSELSALCSQGYSGACWGYDFDWEARHARLPAFTPTIVATGIVTNALDIVHRVFESEEAFALCDSATKFVLTDLHRTFDGEDGSCWSYSPCDRQLVLNATMKGARLCAQVYSATAREELYDAARASVTFVVRHQLPEGGWPYAIGDERSWCDNFHTAYVLDCLAEYARRTGDTTFSENLERGWHFYRKHYFHDDRIPKYYDHSLYPIDATACGQSVLTLCGFGDLTTAQRVAEWVLEHLAQRDGSFAYRKHRTHVTRIHFARWSTAWIACSLATLAAATQQA